MKLIIGLGNPGEKYKNNRHNVGIMIADRLQNTLKSNDIIIKKSDKFMNESGSFVKRLISKYPNIPISSIYIVHDDLDIRLGEYKIQFGKGPKDHNGLNDIYDKLGTKDFWHVRVGVDNRSPENRIRGEDYVLRDFTEEEKLALKKVIRDLVEDLQDKL